jgi:octaprenyl-diphosphate synthase
VRYKTAKLFEAAAEVGAIVAGATAEQQAAAAAYGRHIGTAFQLIDDVLDYSGNVDVLGKSVGDDLREGKCTLPLIAAMQRGTAEQAAIVRAAIEQGSTEQLATVVDIVRSTGALDVAREAAHAEARRAIDAINVLPANPHTASLLQLASQLLERRT